MKLNEYVSEVFQIILAILLASIGLKAFLLPNGFLDGGVTGVAILLSVLFKINISYILPVVTIPFFLIGWFTLSKRIIYKSAISVLSLAIMIHVENFEAVTEDKLLIAIFGGIFLGAGIGLAIKNGTVLDGAEIIGIYINERFGISIGTVVLVFNIFLFAITAVTISIEVALYSILTFIVTAKVIDFVFKGFDDYVGLWVISKHSTSIQKKLSQDVKTGLTIYTGTKGIGSAGYKENIEIIQVLLNRIDSRKAHRVINSEDPNAFIVEFDVNEVKGGLLRRFLKN
jgi:uncharacterized membrane-anchored protein YitT (DUF2179 family)